MRSLTIGGLPGTGSSTLSQLLQEQLDLPYIYAGALFRAEASRRGMTLAEFGKACEEDPSCDRELDEHQANLLADGGILLEGRLAGWLAHSRNFPALKVWLHCDEDERIRRVTERDGGDLAVQREEAFARQASEAERYMKFYAVDLAVTDFYDLVLDSTSQSPAALAEIVAKHWNQSS